MNMRLTHLNYIILICVILVFGCSRKVASFTVVSTNTYEQNRNYESIGIIEGIDRLYIISFIPTKDIYIDNAVKDALNKHNAEYITDTSIKMNHFYLPYIGGYVEYKVTGEGWRLNNNQELIKIEELEKKESNIIRFDPETGVPLNN